MDLQVSLSIAHASDLLRAGLIAIAAGDGIVIAGCYRDAEGAIEGIAASRPAVALIDSALPSTDGFTVARKVLDQIPGIAVVIISPAADTTHLARARAAGAVNCIAESCSALELLATIRNAALGRAPKPPEPFAVVAARLAASGPDGADRHLTLRERQVLRHLAYGLSNDEISAALGIGLETVKTHVHKLLQKMSMRDRTQVAVWAVKNGVV
ncbi:MAG: response regulator transcription factor [Planctomycetia bacterium]